MSPCKCNLTQANTRIWWNGAVWTITSSTPIVTHSIKFLEARRESDKLYGQFTSWMLHRAVCEPDDNHFVIGVDGMWVGSKPLPDGAWT
jgi:hypothetical protein